MVSPRLLEINITDLGGVLVAQEARQEVQKKLQLRKYREGDNLFSSGPYGLGNRLVGFERAGQ